MGVEEVSATGLKLKNDQAVGADEPIKISSKMELLEKLEEGDATDTLAERIDFEKQHLVVFRWAGSGQDSLYLYRMEKDGDEALTFAYRPGMTRDLRQHSRFYLVPKDAEWEVITQPPAKIGRGR